MPVVGKLVARGFRNLASVSWAPVPGRQVVLGDNGAGKTSLLEAIYVLATTRSFRTHRLAVCVGHSTDRFDLSGEVLGDARARLAVSWGAQPGGRSEPRLRRSVNDATVSTAEYLAVLPSVAWSASASEVVSGPPSARRRFLDQGLVAAKPGLFEVLSRYRQALAQKRALLREGRVSELETWNQVLAPMVAEIVRERAHHALEIDRTMGTLVAVAAAEIDPTLRVRLRYRPSVSFAGEPSAEEALDRLESVRRTEIERRAPTLGPQRDELEIRWRDHPAAAVTSAGERKLLGLSLYAARGRLLEATDRVPIYLLDDLDTELDERRLRVVWGLFPERSQLLVTSNRPQVWKGIETDRIWSLQAGQPPSEAGR